NFVTDIPGTSNARQTTPFRGNFGQSQPLAKGPTTAGLSLGAASVGVGLYMTVETAKSGDAVGTVVNTTLVSAEATGLTISAAGVLAGDAAVVAAGTAVS